MASLTDLSGKVALVTGASRGIGLACAEILAMNGASVMLNSISDSEALKKTATDLEKRSSRKCWAYVADAGDTNAVGQLYKDILKEAGRLDILVANAGVMEDARIGMISSDQIEKLISVNIIGLINHLQPAARLMARNGGGSIIAMSSIIGVEGNVGQTLYGATKAAIIGAVKSASKELAEQDIRVNAIAPGFIDTAMTQKLPSAIKAERLRSIGMKRIGMPEDVAKAVLFLAGDLSSYITGQVLGVDGGMII